MTGFFASPPACGAQTFTVRQSSLCGRPGRAGPGGAAAQQAGPKLVAWRTPAQGSGGWGGRQRNAPTGAAAYGMPLYAVTPCASGAAPSTRPAPVKTGCAAGTWAWAHPAAIATDAATIAVFGFVNMMLVPGPCCSGGSAHGGPRRPWARSACQRSRQGRNAGPACMDGRAHRSCHRAATASGALLHSAKMASAPSAGATASSRNNWGVSKTWGRWLARLGLIGLADA